MRVMDSRIKSCTARWIEKQRCACWRGQKSTETIPGFSDGRGVVRRRDGISCTALVT